MRHIYRFAIALTLLCAYTELISAQTGYSGKNFWLSFPQNAKWEAKKASPKFTIDIVGPAGTKGTVEEFAIGRFHHIQIPSTGVLEYPADSLCESIDLGSAFLAIQVIMEADVHILAVSSRTESADTYAAIPTEYLGKQYAVIGYDPITNITWYHTQCDVIATEDSTVLTVDMPPFLNKPESNHIVKLQRGQVLHLCTTSPEESPDLSGTIISSNLPIAVVTGHACAQVPPSVAYCDMLMEMIPPINTIGNEYLIGTFAGQERTSIRIVATEQNTDVTIGNAAKAIHLNKGQFYTCDTISQPTTVSSTHPVYVMQYLHSHDDNKSAPKVGDPSMLLLAPTDRYLKATNVFIPTPSQMTGGKGLPGQYKNYISVVIRTTDINSLQLDGKKVEGMAFIAIGKSNYSIGQLSLAPGDHTISAASPCETIAYGYGAMEPGVFSSYAHLCGMDLRKK